MHMVTTTQFRLIKPIKYLRASEGPFISISPASGINANRPMYDFLEGRAFKLLTDDAGRRLFLAPVDRPSEHTFYLNKSRGIGGFPTAQVVAMMGLDPDKCERLYLQFRPTDIDGEKGYELKTKAQ